MRPFQGKVWGCALAALAVATAPAHAAWNNVFQVCCSTCGHAPAPAVAAYADPGGCPSPCQPTTSCTTRYVQRCYYQPIVTYKTSTYYEPVTTYRTSYYYQPVTTYRYSCYYDPCTCRYQSVAQPSTSYLLRSRCCPVTSYLQRTCATPVTSYQQSFYYEPVTTCCTTTTGAPVASLPPGAVTTPPPGSGATAAPPPGASETREPAVPAPPPGTAETRDPGTPASDSRKIDRNPTTTPPGVMPRAAEGTLRTVPIRPPAVRFDRIASLEGNNLQGKVVDKGRAPRAGARVLFVSVEGKNIQHTVTADADGAFRTRLSAGGWLVYTHDANGRPVFSRRVEVQADRAVTMTLVNR
jgi:Carboxypeptidase regulatory-like domain